MDSTRRFQLFERPLPALGNPAKKYPFILSEPEINVIHEVTGFFTGMRQVMSLIPPSDPNGKTTKVWLDRCFSTLNGLSQSLAQFDDGDAPAPAESPSKEC